MRILKTTLCGCALVSASHAVAADVTDAEGTADTIIVTARKVPEALLDAPLSISVLSAADLDRQRQRSLSDIAGRIPNITFNGGIGGQLQGQIAIRGIATLARNIGVEPGIGITVDGVQIGRPESFDQDLLDIAAVEVLRGPQGTVFGKNTIAGVISLTSAAPTEALSGHALVEGGNYGLVRVQGAISGPLASDLLGRIAVGYVSRGGFSRQVGAGRDADAADMLSWRGTLAYAPADDLAITIRTDGLRDRGVPGFFSTTDIAGGPDALPPRRIDNNRPNALSRNVAGVSLTGVKTFGRWEFTTITAYRHMRYRAALDDDQRQIDLLAADDFGDETDLWSQELRLNGKVGDSVDILVGAYFLDQDTRTDRILTLGADIGVPGFPSLTTRGGVDVRSYAGYGNIDWHAGDRVTLSAGLRYTHERKSVSFVQDDETGIFAFLGLPTIRFADRRTDDDVSPTLSASYRLGRGASLYARVARGFKSGAYNVDLAPSTSGLAAGPERATTYEAGLKLQPFGDILYLALAGFHTDYTDLQVSQLTGSGTTLSNAAKASIDGFELEFRVRPMAALRLEGSAGYADGRYDRFANCPAPLSEGGGARDCGGNRLVGSPKFTAQGAAEYEVPVAFGSVAARLEAGHRSAIYFDPTNSVRFRGRGYTLLNARLTARAEGWTISGWIENLTDKTYETYRDDRSAIGVLRTTAYGAPRTYGLSVGKTF